jgi:TetR/AcrR family transcriptional repressor of mexJK operon
MHRYILFLLDPSSSRSQDLEMGLHGETLLFTGKPQKRPREAGRGPGRPSREQSERRNQELLDRALDLFLERGFEGTTIEAIVDSVGMARRTVYARYGDKLTLFKAALQRAIDDWVVPEEQLRAAETEDFAESIHRVARLMVANALSPSGMRLTRIAHAEVIRMPEIGAYLAERTERRALAYLVDLFRRHLALANAEDAALAFMLLVVDGAFQAKVWHGVADEELDRQVVYRTTLFLNGVSSSQVRAKKASV